MKRFTCGGDALGNMHTRMRKNDEMDIYIAKHTELIKFASHADVVGSRIAKVAEPGSSWNGSSSLGDTSESTQSEDNFSAPSMASSRSARISSNSGGVSRVGSFGHGPLSFTKSLPNSTMKVAPVTDSQRIDGMGFFANIREQRKRQRSLARSSSVNESAEVLE